MWCCGNSLSFFLTGLRVHQQRHGDVRCEENRRDDRARAPGERKRRWRHREIGGNQSRGKGGRRDQIESFRKVQVDRRNGKNRTRRPCRLSRSAVCFFPLSLFSFFPFARAFALLSVALGRFQIRGCFHLSSPSATRQGIADRELTRSSTSPCFFCFPSQN